MKTTIIINPQYSHFEEQIRNIPGNFYEQGATLRMARNEVKLIDIKGNKLVVKYFKTITFFNRLLFANTSRWSKAKRAYNNSLKLIELDINTPEPVAYIDIVEHGVLTHCFYVYKYIDYIHVEELFKQDISLCESALKEFAAYSLKLHKLGVFHDDYGISNVMYLFDGKHYNFAIIDNNRMRFMEYTPKHAFFNLRRFELPDNKFRVVIEEYARLSGLDYQHVYSSIMNNRNRFLRSRRLKSDFKKLLFHHNK